MNKQLVKMAVNLIGRDKLKEAIGQATTAIIEAQENIQLEGCETSTVLIIARNSFNGVFYGHIYTIDDEINPPQLIRPINSFNIVEKITQAIEQL